jgi:hypothetical protein
MNVFFQRRMTEMLSGIYDVVVYVKNVITATQKKNKLVDKSYN